MTKVSLPKTAASKRSFREPPISLDRVVMPTLKKTEYMTLKCRSDPTDADSEQYELSIRYFRTGKPEEFLLLMKDFQKIIVGQNLTTGPAKYAMMRRILDGDALAAFNQAAQALGNETNEHFGQCVERLTSHVFPNRSLAIQRRYMRRYMRKPKETKIREYLARVVELNSYLPLFPGGDDNAKLSDDELCDILEFATPASWQRQMTLQAFDPLEHTPQEVVEFCERLEVTEDVQKSTENPPKNPSDSNPKKRSKSSSNGKGSGKFYCRVHGNNTSHNTDKCKVVAGIAEKKQEEWAKSNKKTRYNPSDRNNVKHEVTEFANSKAMEAMVGERVEEKMKKVFQNLIDKKKRKRDVEDLDSFNFDLEGLAIDSDDADDESEDEKSAESASTEESA